MGHPLGFRVHFTLKLAGKDVMVARLPKGWAGEEPVRPWGSIRFLLKRSGTD